MELVRYYLLTKRKHHKPGISHSERTLVASASKRFKLEDGVLMFVDPYGRWLKYIDDKKQRENLITNIHLLVLTSRD